MICIIAVGNRYDGQNVFRSITDFAFDNSLFNIQKREEGFLICTISFMLDLIFNNKQKRPPISIIDFDLKNGP